MKSRRSLTPSFESSNEKTGISKRIVSKERTSWSKDLSPVKANPQRVSLIPKLIPNNETRGTERKLEKSEKPTKTTGSPLRSKNEFTAKNKKPFDDKISTHNNGFGERYEKKRGSQSKPSSRENCGREPESPELPRRLTSDPQVFNKTTLEGEILCKIESGDQKISEIWKKPTSDLSKTLKNLKRKSVVDFKETVEIQQAKSRDAAKIKAELAKLDKTGSGLESLLHNDTLKSEKEISSSEIVIKSRWDSTDDQKLGGSGDLPKSKTELGVDTGRNPQVADVIFPLKHFPSDSSKRNVTKKLNLKIFEIEKTCKEHLQERQQLQMLLVEFNERLQWNQILLKQIRKLKGKIEEIQEKHEKLKSETAVVEIRLANQEKEVEKVNALLLQKKFVNDGENFREVEKKLMGGEDAGKNSDGNLMVEKIIEDKKNSISVLKMILNVMLDQEDFARKQVAMFQSKIQELEKSENERDGKKMKREDVD